MPLPPSPTPAPGPDRPGPVHLLSVPARHPYVDAVRPVGALPVAPGRTTGWEPDPVLSPGSATGPAAAWLAEADVVHLHFGFDQLTAPAARVWLADLTAARVPLVLTVHDLRNPHHLDRRQHDAVLGPLVEGAAAVLTLTPGAAAEVARRFGRQPRVLPHPTLVDPSRTSGVATEPGLVTMHLKSLRTNLVEPLRLVRAAARGATLGGGRLRIDVHPDVIDDPRLAGLDQLAAATGAEVAVHERYDDVELERQVRRSHATVLPHRWGTHSGWLELARDLGTRVVAPSCGYYAGQWDAVVTYGHDEEQGLDESSLTAAVARAATEPAPPPADRATRLAELAEVRRAHAEVYAEVRAGVRAGVRSGVLA